MLNRMLLWLWVVWSWGWWCWDVINVWTSSTFNSWSTTYISSTMISDNKMLIVYRDTSNSNYWTAIVATITWTSISYWSEYVFSAWTNFFNSVQKISEDKALIAFRENSKWKAIVATITWTSISYWSEYEFSTTSSWYMKTALVWTDKILIWYTDFWDSQKWKWIITNISWTVLSFWSSYTFTNVRSTDFDIDRLEDDKVIIVYRSEWESNEWKAKIWTISWTVISYWTETEYLSTTSNNNSVAVLSTDKILISYKDVLWWTWNRWFSVVWDISWTTITVWTSVQFNTWDNVAPISSTKAWDDKVLIVYWEVTWAINQSKTVLATIVLDTVSFWTPVIFNINWVWSYFEVNNAKAWECKFFLSYDDSSDSNSWNWVILTLTE